MSESLLRALNQVALEVNSALNELLVTIHQPKVLYDSCNHLIQAGGKRLRPFLTLKACEIVGGKTEDALPAAASIELIHNFTILHDDIMDEDSNRRGVPTVHILWGVPMAINAGDMLFVKAYEALLGCKVPAKQLLKMISIITDATINICEGQALDMLFAERIDVSEEEYLGMVYKKTAALLEAAAKLGALVGGGTASQVKKLGTLSCYAGIAFQIVDDILGLTAEEKVLGKPVGSDIREGKSTILLIHALTHATDDQRKHILSVLGKKEAEKDQIFSVIRTIKSIGSIEYAAKKAEEYLTKAKSQIFSFPPAPSKDILIDLCDYMASRSY